MGRDAKGQLIRPVRKSELSQDVQAFIIDRQARGLSPRTIEFYADELRHWVTWPERDHIESVQSISPDALRRYLVALAGHRNAGGVHAAYRAIRAFLNWFGEEYELPNWTNPIRKLRPPRVRDEPLDPVRISDLKKMLATCKRRTFTGDRDRAIMFALLDTGCRASEFLSLDVKDTNLSTGAIIVRHAKGNRTRVVFLGAKARQAVSRYLRHRDTPSGALWITVCGERMAYQGLRSMLRRRARKAGVRMPGPHSFRRAFCLSMLRDGADLVSLQRLLGHSDLSVIRRYLKQTQDDLKSVHERHGPVDRAL